MHTVIEQDGVRITLKRRSYGEKLESSAVTNQHVPAFSAQPTARQRAHAVGRGNFAFCMSFVQKVEGADLIIPHAEMSPDEFEAAYQRFAAMDDVLIERLLEACQMLSRPATAPEHAPPGAVQAEATADPLS